MGPGFGPATSAGKVRARAALLFASALLALALAALAILAAPQEASAKDYTMPKVDISAEVQADGTLAVDEKRTFDFDGSFTCVWWTFESLPSGSTLAIDEVSLIDPSGRSVLLEEVPFQTSWRSSGGPGFESYAVDAALKSIYVFFNVADESLTVDMGYSIDGAAQAHADVAELYWQFVGPAWAEASNNVTCTVTLPAPSGAAVQPGEDVRAWGHGPLNGEVAIEDDGTVIYTMARVVPGEFAEARITFPVSWLTALDPNAVDTTEALPGILSEEQQWADQANARRFAAWALVGFCVLVALGLIAWALVMFFRHGKEYKPEFQEEYWRDVPDPQATPAAIGRLWRWEAESPNDFTATVMELAHKGAIKMEQGTYADERGRMVQDYCMIKVPEVADSVNAGSHPAERAVLDMLFDQFPAGASALTESSQQHVWFGTINKYGEEHPQEFSDAMDQFQTMLSRKVDNLGYFEPKGSLLKMVMATVAFLTVGLGVMATVLLENFIPVVCGALAGIVLFVISRFMSRMTHQGAEVRAKAAALKRWLEDFSALDERPPTDVKVWGEFMVYAYEFGIADQVMRELQLKVPEVFAEPQMSSGVMPWWFWYSPHYAQGLGISLSQALATTITNTMSTVNAALSTSSSGGGLGGGFSMGGGGGFGGGGGGAR